MRVNYYVNAQYPDTHIDYAADSARVIIVAPVQSVVLLLYITHFAFCEMKKFL